MARLLSVNVGLSRDVVGKRGRVATGVWKRPVTGRCRAGRLNLEGDGQGDLAGHGGEHRAVFVYQIESYRYWQEQLKRSDFVYGQFGENFTIQELADDAVCIGDRFQIGTALFEVTQPRVTCYRVGIRMNEPRMASLLTSSGRPGFYFRVLREGEVGAGDEIVKVGEAAERMTVAEINALLYLPPHPRDRLERALRIEALAHGGGGSFEADRRRPGAFSQLLALGPSFSGALSNQRENRAGWSGWKLSTRTFACGRSPRCQLAARKFYSAAGRATGRTAQCRNRRDTGFGDAAGTCGGALYTSGLVVADGA